MKNILAFILILLSFSLQAQEFIGASKKDMVNVLSKRPIKYDLKGDTISFSGENGTKYFLYLKNDTVLYYQTLIDNVFLNKTKQGYDDDTKGLYYVQDWVWINHVPHRGSFLYTIAFPEKTNKFLTTVQRVK